MALVEIFVLILLYFMLFVGCFWVIVFLDNLDILWNDPKPKKKYFISVLIPAYNEEESIEETIKSVLKQNYPKDLFEVIVINDGSTDNTKKICKGFEKKGLIKLFNKTNGGKASAMNVGIKKAKGELIYVVDADSFSDINSFNHLIGYFNNPKVAAVTSSMIVTKSNGFFEKIQWLEYLFSVFMRKVMSLFNCLYVTPGPGSIYRKKVLEEIGGFSEKTLTEDMEVAFNIQNHNYLIENSLNSIVLTNTPYKLYDLIKQRRRWYTGFIEDSMSYKHFYFNKKKGFLGLFLLPANIISTFSLLFITIYSFYSLFKNGLNLFFDFKSIGLSKSFELIDFSMLSLSFYGINTFSVIGVLFLIFSIIIIYYSVKTSNQKIDIKNNYLSYLLYLFLYSLLMSLFWLDSITYKLLFRKIRKGWKYGSKESLN